MFADFIRSTFNPGTDLAAPESARVAERHRIERMLSDINRAEPGYFQPASRSGLMARIDRMLNP